MIGEACPFCGCIHVHAELGTTQEFMVAVCDGCGAQAGEVRRGDAHIAPTDEDICNALEAWNTRGAN